MMTGAAWRRGDAYELRVGKTNVILTTTSGASLHSLTALRQRLGDEPYLWTRISGRDYLIRDEDFLREAAAMYAPIDALKPEQDALEAEEELDHRLDAIYDGDTKAEPGELQRLRERNRVVSQRQRELDRQEEALEKVIEGKLRGMVEQAIRDGRAQALR